MRTAIRLGLLLVGLGIVGALITHTGVDVIWATLSRLGPLAPLTLLPYGFVYLVDTAGWSLSFAQSPHKRVSWWRFARIRWAGESTNYVVPTGYLGGEAVKVYLLNLQGIPPSESAPSAVTSKTCQTLAQILFLVLGAAMAISYLPSDSPLRIGMFAITLLGILGFGGLLVLQKIGFYHCLTTIAKALRVGSAWLAKRQHSIAEIDSRIRAFYRDHPARFRGSVSAYLAGWLADTVEIWWLAQLLGHPIPWTQAIALEAFIGVAKILGMFIPGSLGIQESGVVLLCHWFRLPIEFGTSYAIFRRLREVLYAALGMLWLSCEFPSWQAFRQVWQKNSASTDPDPPSQLPPQ